jgi:dipeptidyl aminopeptidase/acylaminoacyl peptidase
MPDDFEKVKYSLCSISFDSEKKIFGESVDTLYNAKTMDKSVALPRVSPDGKYLLYTLSSYGNFFIWHKDADLYMMDLASNNHYPLREVNSDNAESYHSWSSNSRWIVFSSRRMDGLYTHPYFAYIDANGQASKPFLLPQKDAGFYAGFMKSYNIPEFVKGRIRTKSADIVEVAKKDKGFDIKFSNANKFPAAKPVEEMAH